MNEISFYDTNLKKWTTFTLSDKSDTWLDEDGNETTIEEIEFQLNNYAKKKEYQIGISKNLEC